MPVPVAKPAPEAAEAPFERMFAVIDCVIAQRAPISVTEIGELLSLPTPTVHRIARQLTEKGFLKRALGSKRLVPGRRLTALGLRAAGAAFLSDPPHAVLVGLSAQLGEHCQIGVMTDGRVVYVDSVEAPRPHGLQFSAGAAAPLHCTSIGKLYLARMSDRELGQVLATLPLERFTETTICDPALLMKEIARIRHLGWASSNMEYSAGVVGCAVPILDGTGAMVAGLGTSVPGAHVAFRDLAKLIPTLQVAAAAIAGRLA